MPKTTLPDIESETYPMPFLCMNCNHRWTADIQLRFRVAYSQLEHAMIARDQANSDNAQIIMCPNCHCLEDVVKDTTLTNEDNLNDDE
jgi:hypothetical protein